MELDGVLLYGCDSSRPFRTGRLHYEEIIPDILRLNGLREQEVEGIMPYISDLSLKSIGLAIAKYANANATPDNSRWQKLHEVACMFIFR